MLKYGNWEPGLQLTPLGVARAAFLLVQLCSGYLATQSMMMEAFPVGNTDIILRRCQLEPDRSKPGIIRPVGRMLPVYVYLLSNLMNHANELGRGSIYGVWEGSDQIPPVTSPLSACWEAKSLPRYVVSLGGMSQTKRVWASDLVAAFGHLDASTDCLLGGIFPMGMPARRSHATPFPCPGN